MFKQPSRIINIYLVGFFCAFMLAAQADTQVWRATTGDWFVVDNWTNTTTPSALRYPAAGDEVVVTNAAALVYLTNSTEWLSSLVISNATVSCSKWDTTLNVTNLAILKSGKLSCEGPFTNNAVSNRVCLTCTNLLIETGGSINVQGKGFSGGLTITVGVYGNGHGPGGGKSVGSALNSGGGYGGYGSFGFNNANVTTPNGKGHENTNTYGNVQAPLDPGSGGQGGYEAGAVPSHGDGAVCITADQVVVNGTINADASGFPANFSHASGGSGGGIFITCRKITGANGVISANGADAYPAMNGGGGGGGRIAVIYDPITQSSLPVPALQFSVKPGVSGKYIVSGDIGTLYFPDSYFFSPSNLFTGQWLAPCPATAAVSECLISNVWSRLPGLSLKVTNNMTIFGTNYALNRLEFTNNASIICGGLTINGAAMVMTCGTNAGPTLTCDGDFTMINTGMFYIAAGLTCPGEATNYGAKVRVGGNMSVYSNCWIYPYAHPTNGTVPLFSMRNISIYQGGGINADTNGYIGGISNSSGYGPGAAKYQKTGASYGGQGAIGNSASPDIPDTYGSSNSPVEPGSGAVNGSTITYRGANGGGSVQLRALDTVTIMGTITANGWCGDNALNKASGTAAGYGGGGSGGAIYISCRTFIGTASGMLRANGGNGNWAAASSGGGGGGGRIAVWRIFDKSTGAISNSVSGGLWFNTTGKTTNAAGTGTIVWGWLMPPSGTVVSIY